MRDEWRRQAADNERRYDLERLTRILSTVALLPDDQAGTGEGWRRLRLLGNAARTAREHLATHHDRPGQDDVVGWLEELQTAAEEAVAAYDHAGHREYLPGQWLALVQLLQALAAGVR